MKTKDVYDTSGNKTTIVVDKRVNKSQEQEVEFNISKTLIIIENDKDLDEMFREKYGTDYNMCHALINSDTGLKPKAEKFIKALFDGVIVKRKSLLNKYNNINLKVEGASEGASEEKKPNKKKRWGLIAIANDIVDNFSGKPKQVHRTGKKVQELKKMFTRLEMRMFNERFDNKSLSDKELRELGGAIDIFNKKVESILNPKK